MTDAQWKRAEKLHVEEGLSCPKVASKLGAAHSTILYGLKKRGAYVPRPRALAITPESRKLYKAWSNMHSRCSDLKNDGYFLYGGKGARVCKRWSEFDSFRRWALEAGWQAGLCLSRNGRAKVFSPTNCIWITRAEAARTADHTGDKMWARWTITAFGETKGPTDWSRDARCTVTLTSLLSRLHKGWDAKSTISEPGRPQCGPKPKHMIKAFGTTKGVSDWTRDARCTVSINTVLRRLERGLAPERAIGDPAHRRRRS